MQAHVQNTSTLPVLCLLFGASLWGIFWYPLRYLESQGLNGLWASLLIYGGTMLVAIPYIYQRFHELRVSRWHVLAIMICSGWCNVSFILAVIEGEVVRVILLFYLSPVWAAFLAHFILKEKLTSSAKVMIVLALSGAVIMLWSPNFGYPWPDSRADWLALSSGMAFALTNMFVHMTRQCSIQIKTSAALLGVVLVAGVMIAVENNLELSVDSGTVYLALAIGLFLMSSMTFCVVYGVTHMPIHRSAVLLIFEIVAAAISAYLLTDERLTVREWIGGGIVILAAYMAALQHKKQNDIYDK